MKNAKTIILVLLIGLILLSCSSEVVKYKIEPGWGGSWRVVEVKSRWLWPENVVWRTFDLDEAIAYKALCDRSLKINKGEGG